MGYYSQLNELVEGLPITRMERLQHRVLIGALHSKLLRLQNSVS